MSDISKKFSYTLHRKYFTFEAGEGDLFLKFKVFLIQHVQVLVCYNDGSGSGMVTVTVVLSHHCRVLKIKIQRFLSYVLRKAFVTLQYTFHTFPN